MKRFIPIVGLLLLAGRFGLCACPRPRTYHSPVHAGTTRDASPAPHHSACHTSGTTDPAPSS